MAFSDSMTPMIREDAADVACFILESGLFEAQHLPHTPFLVEHEGHIVLVDNAQQLLELPNDTVVMGQWPGKQRSDYFRFTVKVYKAYHEAGLIGKKDCSFQEIQATLIRRKEETERQLKRLRRDEVWQQFHAILAEGKYICLACDWDMFHCSFDTFLRKNCKKCA